MTELFMSSRDKKLASADLTARVEDCGTSIWVNISTYVTIPSQHSIEALSEQLVSYFLDSHIMILSEWEKASGHVLADSDTK